MLGRGSDELKPSTESWGSGLEILADQRPDLRIVNLENAITTNPHQFPAGNKKHFKMHPDNIESLTSANIDCCCIANDHVFDYGIVDDETQYFLEGVGIRHAGVGVDSWDAGSPTMFPVDIPPLVTAENLFCEKSTSQDSFSFLRVGVISAATFNSGVPRTWAATVDKPGMHVIDLTSERRISLHLFNPSFLSFLDSFTPSCHMVTL